MTKTPNLPAVPDDLATALAPLKRQRYAAFVAAYLTNRNATAAARAAGYAAKSAAQMGYQLLRRLDIQQAIEAGRAALAKRAEYDFAAASDTLQKAMTFAYETKNANAAVRAAEVLAKLHGHLIERQDVRAQGDVIFSFPFRRLSENEGEG